jgi:hypothetical protein
MSKKRVDAGLAREKSAFASFPIVEEAYPIVAIPADVKASIARAEAAVIAAGQESPAATAKDLPPDIRTAVTDKDAQDKFDAHVENLALAAKGKRQQPPMTDRLRAVMILVEREIADGTPFAVGPNSKMNQKIRASLNARGARTTDSRKSRQKQKIITAGAVRTLLKQIRTLR